MTFLTPTELRHTLKISRSTEHRLLKNGMPSMGGGRLRRYEEEAAVEWFAQYAHQSTSMTLLPPGDYRCACGFEGTLEKATSPGPCPRCGSREMPGRVTLHPLPM
jgi:hypothetical protein